MCCVHCSTTLLCCCCRLSYSMSDFELEFFIFLFNWFLVLERFWVSHDFNKKTRRPAYYLSLTFSVSKFLCTFNSCFCLLLNSHVSIKICSSSCIFVFSCVVLLTVFKKLYSSKLIWCGFTYCTSQETSKFVPVAIVTSLPRASSFDLIKDKRINFKMVNFHEHY